MRDYSKFGPRFWSGETGKWLRTQGRDHQVVGVYLFTCPMANMIGLYYLNLATLVDEVGHIDREGALKVLRSLSEGGYATFDEATSTVFVVEMAKHQIGERLAKRDNRHKAVVKELEQYRKCPFFNAFLDRYADAYELESVRRNGENSKALARGLQAPSKPGAGTGAGTGEGSEGGAGTGTEAGTGTRASTNGHGGEARAGEDFFGQSAPPEEPSSRRAGNGERRNGNFEQILDAVEKLVLEMGFVAADTRGIARAGHISVSQVETAIRQLRDRGRLPAVAA